MHVLVVDDDTSSRTSIARFLKIMGHQVTQCDEAKEALDCIRAGNFPLVLTDIKMPEMSGLDLLREASLLPSHSQTKVVLFTGHGSMETAIEALRMGAYDYLLKPVKAEELMSVINKIKTFMGGGKKKTVPIETKQKPKATLGKDICLGDGKIIGVTSRKMQQVVAQALTYHTDRSIPVLIQGDTGTGKELVARLIHDGGQHTDRPFVDINCAAIQPNLFESELFGYKAGAFTGGMGKDQKGKFDIAQGGTIFLDEVAEISVELQVKLLRVIQEREYYRVGGVEKIGTDARIICATNVNLIRAVNEGKFRRDLYFRLQVGQIFLPPLRERTEDILPLAIKFLAEFSRQKRKNFNKVSKEAGEALLNHNWPGNVRELRNLIERAVLMYDEKVLLPEHLESTYHIPEPENSPVGNVARCLKKNESLIKNHIDQLIEDALQKHNGNKAATARYLGISRRSLYRLLDKLST